MIGSIPNIFRRIQFRSIRGEPFNVNPRMPQQKSIHFFASMDRGSIPQKDQRPAKMLQQIFQKGVHIQTIQIPLPNLDKKSQPAPLGRNCQRTDRRKLVFPVAVIQSGRLSPRSPRAGNRGNEQKAALIEKKQVGATFSRVFLYAASDTASNGRSLVRSSLLPGAPASGNSTPSLKVISKHGWGDIQPRSSSELFGQPAARSTNRCDIQKIGHPPARAHSVSLFVRAVILAAARESFWVSALLPPFPDRPSSIARLSFWKLRATGRWLKGWLCPFLTTEWRVGAVFPARSGCHGVSCSLL